MHEKYVFIYNRQKRWWYFYVGFFKLSTIVADLGTILIVFALYFVHMRAHFLKRAQAMFLKVSVQIKRWLLYDFDTLYIDDYKNATKL